MKSLLIILNWLLAFCAMSINTEASPLWAIAACVAWMAVATWLLVKYASPTDALRVLVKMRRFWRSLFRPKISLEEFYRQLDREAEKKRRPGRAVAIEAYYRRMRYANNPDPYFEWLKTPQVYASEKEAMKKDIYQDVLNSLAKAMDRVLKI
jgi:hypothetical protein